ncbi:MAG TPA: Asp23/Gls24 family envelope stress response protein [Clostridiales bacterium]|nr:Asp23/Gls24 family envelope stress response protein [Clostridiales bacterium]
MGVKKSNELGEITISNEVIATLAGISAIESYGVVGMASKKATDGLAELLGHENLTRGVKVSTQDDNIFIDLFIIVEYGVSIITVAKNVIDRVKYNVENLTGMTVKEVNVMVQGVRV